VAEQLEHARRYRQLAMVHAGQTKALESAAGRSEPEPASE
jgi:hypothetical protein